MKAKQLFLLLIFLLANSGPIFCQGQLSVIDNSVNPGLVIEEFKTKQRQSASNEFYLNESWQSGRISLKNGLKIESYPLKFDVFNQQVEIKVDDKVKVCPSHLINDFAMLNLEDNDSIKFVNTLNFEFQDNVPLTGFFQLIYENNYSLIAYYQVLIQQPNYVEALDIGSKQEKKVKREEYFIVDKNRILCELPSHSKKLTCPELPENYNTDTKMKTKTLPQKIKFMEYLNSLSK